VAYEQTRDVLAGAEAFHRQISEYYHRVSDQSSQQRIKMLLDYLSRHEQQLADSLADYEHDASQAVMDTWFQSKHKMDICAVLKDVEISPDMSVDDVVDVGLKVDECLIAMYRDLAESAPSEDVRNVFQNLLDMEEEEKRRLVKNALRAADF
jgi:hypothetical protein